MKTTRSNLTKGIGLVILLASSLMAQDFSKIIDEVNAMENRLKKAVETEAAQRKDADNAILQKQGKGEPVQAGAAQSVQPDSALTAAIKGLEVETAKNRASLDSTAALVVALCMQVDSLSKIDTDGRVAEMAQKPTHQTPAADTSRAEEEEKEAMAVGGLVTVDFASSPSDFRAASAQVGQVALSANVNVADGVLASITLLAEGNLSELSIDQALVAYTPEKVPFSLLFGQQTLNFGLLTTRLISDPLILDDVETAGPGITANFSFGNFSPGIGATFFHVDQEVVTTYRVNFADSTVVATDSVVSPEANLFAGIVNLDFTFLEESMVRVSACYYGTVLELDIGGGLVFGPAALDFEAYGEVMGKADRAGGYYAGLAVTFFDKVKAAVRYDGHSGDSFRTLTHRLGLGATMTFKYGIFCAVEYAVNDFTSAAKTPELALQLGLESTLKLPGFQRKTLTRK